MYTNNILARFDMTDCTPRTLPCDPSVYKILEKPNDYNKNVESPPFEDPRAYRELVGSLIYLMCCTRPDIAFAVSLLSQFMAAPKCIHMKIV